MLTILKTLLIVLFIGRFGNGKIIFQENFEEGNLNKWEYQACPKGVQITSRVSRSGKHSAKFTVSDDDTHDRCPDVPTENPRAQLVSKGLFHNGDEYYIGFSVYFPGNFPRPEEFFQVFELYGEPFGGSPPIGIDICDGNRICLSRDETHDYDHIWESSPIVPNKWRDITLRVKFSTSENTGFVQIWDNGQAQKLSNGKKRVYYATLHRGINWNGTPNAVFLNQYRSSEDKLGTVTIYHDALKVGTTFESVQPASK